MNILYDLICTYHYTSHIHIAMKVFDTILLESLVGGNFGEFAAIGFW